MRNGKLGNLRIGKERLAEIVENEPEVLAEGNWRCCWGSWLWSQLGLLLSSHGHGSGWLQWECSGSAPGSPAALGAGVLLFFPV